MRTINVTEFRKHVSDMLTQVEHGETVRVVRHGRPIAEVSPLTENRPSWKRPALRLMSKGRRLSAAILEEREHETVS